MTINFNVLCVFMKINVAPMWKATYVTIQTHRTRVSNIEVLKQRLKPVEFTTSSSHQIIFSFSRGPIHGWLLFSLPRNKKKTQNHKIADKRMKSQRTSHPIRILINIKMQIIVGPKKKTHTRVST